MKTPNKPARFASAKVIFMWFPADRWGKIGSCDSDSSKQRARNVPVPSADVFACRAWEGRLYDDRRAYVEGYKKNWASRISSLGYLRCQHAARVVLCHTLYMQGVCYTRNFLVMFGITWISASSPLIPLENYINFIKFWEELSDNSRHSKTEMNYTQIKSPAPVCAWQTGRKKTNNSLLR